MMDGENPCEACGSFRGVQIAYVYDEMATICFLCQRDLRRYMAQTDSERALRSTMNEIEAMRIVFAGAHVREAVTLMAAMMNLRDELIQKCRAETWEWIRERERR